MTLSKIIQRQLSGDYQSFALPEVGQPEPEPVEELPNLPTAEEIEAIQKQAYDEGFKQGHLAGMATGKVEIDKQIKRLASILKVVAQPLDELDEHVVKQITDLSIIIAKQVIRRELRIDPGQVVGVVRDCVKALPVGTTKVNIFLHPDDAELVRTAFSLEDRDETTWHIVEEPVLTRGGCRIEAQHSRIDATVESRLNQIIATLLGGEREDDQPAE